MECPQCKRTYPTEHSLRKHTLDVHGEKFNCDQCKKSFTKKCSLQRHINEQHSSPDKKLSCHICDYKASRKSHLIRHNRHYHRQPTSPTSNRPNTARQIPHNESTPPVNFTVTTNTNNNTNTAPLGKRPSGTTVSDAPKRPHMQNDDVDDDELASMEVWREQLQQHQESAQDGQVGSGGTPSVPVSADIEVPPIVPAVPNRTPQFVIDDDSDEELLSELSSAQPSTSARVKYRVRANSGHNGHAPAGPSGAPRRLPRRLLDSQIAPPRLEPGAQIPPGNRSAWSEAVGEGCSIEPNGEFHSRLMRTAYTDFKINIDNFDDQVQGDLIETWEQVRRIIASIIAYLREHTHPDSYTRFSFRFPTTDNDGETDLFHSTSYRLMADTDVEEIVDAIWRRLNSGTAVNIALGFTMHVYTTALSSGGSRTPSLPQRTDLSIQDALKRGRGVIDACDKVPDRNPQLCLARSIVCGRMLADISSSEEALASREKMRRHSTAQEAAALQLHEEAGVSTTLGRWTIEHVQRFQNVLPDHRVVLYNSLDINQTPQLFDIGDSNPKKSIYLLLDEERSHYYCISSMTAFLDVKKFCHRCHQGYEKSHTCALASCRFCKLPHCCNESDKPTALIDCEECLGSFKTLECLEEHTKHRVGKKSPCEEGIWCKVCQRKVPYRHRAAADHRCLQTYCTNCKEWQHQLHKCFLQSPELAKMQRDPGVVCGDLSVDHDEPLIDFNDDGQPFYDDEGMEVDEKDEQVRPSVLVADTECVIMPDGQHHPVFFNVDNAEGTHVFEHYGEDCLEEFVEAIFEHRFNNSTIFMHNFASYDGILLLSVLYNRGIAPQVVFNGQKLLQLRLPKFKLTFKCSLKFLPMKLASIPKTMGLTSGVRKGFFPYTYVTLETLHSPPGPVPPLEYFITDRMSVAEVDEVTKWHAAKVISCVDEQGRPNYWIRQEMIEYCYDDCRVLREGLHEYNRLFMALYQGISPLNYLTLPAYVNRAFRTLFMPKDSIALLPAQGFGGNKHSLPAIEWLEFMAKTTGLQIMHARNGGEQKVGSYLIDGYAIDEHNHIHLFEFDGCRFHGYGCVHEPDLQGHPCLRACQDRLQPIDADLPEADRRKQEAEQRRFRLNRQYTKKKHDYLSGLDNHTLHLIHECEYNWLRTHASEGQYAELPDFSTEFRSHYISKWALRPRDGLRGGRTETIALEYVVKDGEEILYFDFTSLYPAINACIPEWAYYPIGHPQIRLRDFVPPGELFGMCTVTVLPPKRLFLPVLPMYHNQGCYYALCQTCVEQSKEQLKTKRVQFCNHSDKQRQFRTTCVSYELQLAIRKGYSVIKTHEQWHWPEEQRTKDLLRCFITPAYLEKVKASGVPESCKTGDGTTDSARLQAYVDAVNQQLGSNLQPTDIAETPNPGMRCLAKLAINNFWGFLAKENNRTSTSYYSDYKKLREMLINPNKVIVDSRLVGNSNVVMVEHRDVTAEPDPSGSLVLACFTTSMSRKLLYDTYEQSGMTDDCLLYMDTDSFIWVKRADTQPGLKTGQLLGDLTNEYPAPNRILHYQSAGAKTYVLGIEDSNTGQQRAHIRAKGITLTRNSQINAETIRGLNAGQSTTAPMTTFRRSKKTGEINTTKCDKLLRNTITKRIRLADGIHTLPWGWVNDGAQHIYQYS